MCFNRGSLERGRKQKVSEENHHIPDCGKELYVVKITHISLLVYSMTYMYKISNNVLPVDRPRHSEI